MLWHEAQIALCFFTSLAKILLDRLASWPNEDIEELEEIAREIESRRAGLYVIDDAEWTALQQESIRQADRGEFASDEVLAEADRRHAV